MKAYFWVAVAVCLTFLSGCAINQPPRVNKNYDISYAPLPIVPSQPKEGSLFDPDTDSSLVADFRARKVGDILTVKIEENLRGSKDVKTKTDKKSSVNVGLTGILGLKFTKEVSPHYPGQKVDATKAIGGMSDNKFDSQGQTSGDTKLTGTISVRVVKKLPGGNLFVRGSREITINNETQYMILTGIVRPADIDHNNEVSSTKIADARITYTGGGYLSEMQHPGWLGRVLGILAPF